MRDRNLTCKGGAAMSESDVKLDEIGFWSEIKLEILKKYASAYSVILDAQAKKGHRLEHYYIDAFAGAGRHISKETRELIPGSPANALWIDPPFSGYYLIDMNSKRVDLLQELAKDRKDVTIYHGDCNRILVEKIFPKVRRDQFRRALCILDPYGLHLDWEILLTAGQMQSVEIFLNFPIMDMNMNVLKRDKSKVDPAQSSRMNAFWGDESWKEAAWDSELDLFGHPVKTGNADIVDSFRERLQKVAGFKYVPQPLPMKNKSNAIVYYLFFASPNETGGKIAKQIFSKYRT